MDKIVWTLLVTVASAAGAALGARLAYYVWTRATHESPPRTSRVTQFLAGVPVKKQVSQRLPG